LNRMLVRQADVRAAARRQSQPHSHYQQWNNNASFEHLLDFRPL